MRIVMLVIDRIDKYAAAPLETCAFGRATSADQHRSVY